jgi:hypothetical protein
MRKGHNGPFSFNPGHPEASPYYSGCKQNNTYSFDNLLQRTEKGPEAEKRCSQDEKLYTEIREFITQPAGETNEQVTNTENQASGNHNTKKGFISKYRPVKIQ